MIIYIATGQVDYEFEDILGVFADREEALQRCRDAAPTEFTYHRYFIRTWELGAAEETDLHAVSQGELAAKPPSSIPTKEPTASSTSHD